MALSWIRLDRHLNLGLFRLSRNSPETPRNSRNSSRNSCPETPRNSCPETPVPKLPKLRPETPRNSNSHPAVSTLANPAGQAANSRQNFDRTISSAYTQNPARVYVTDDPIFEHTGIARDSSATHTQKGADPRTMEIQADIFQSCPGVIVTNNPQAANYVLTLRRRGGQRGSMFAFGGLTGLALSAGIKVDGASLFDRNGDMVSAVKERSVEGAVKKLCPYIIKPGERQGE